MAYSVFNVASVALKFHRRRCMNWNMGRRIAIDELSV